MEGDFLQIVLQTNNTFDVPFTINVTIVEGTAVGKYLVHILHNTHSTLQGRHSCTCVVGRRFLYAQRHYACTILLLLNDKWQKTLSLAYLHLALR